MNVETCLSRLPFVFGVSPTCDCNENEFASPGFTAKTTGGFEPVEFWHANIEHSDVRSKLLGLCYGFQSICRRYDFVTHHLQHDLETLDNIAIIIGDKNTPGRTLVIDGARRRLHRRTDSGR